MIQNKKDLKRYLESDKKALGIFGKKKKIFSFDMRYKIWKFQKLYRTTEYWYNQRHKNLLCKIIAYLYLMKYNRECEKHLCEIPVNCIEEGLVIWHLSNIIINGSAKIGKNFGISANTNIGQAHNKVPIIGDNVTMCYGSSVMGGVNIANNVTIGAKAMVIKNITEEYVTVGGIPAKILRHHDPSQKLIRG